MSSSSATARCRRRGTEPRPTVQERRQRAALGRPARVLHVLSGGTVGGCEQHVLALLTRLDRSRFEPWLACFEARPDDAMPLLPLFRAAGRRTDPAALWRFGELVRRGHFDILHAHSFRTELASVLYGRVLRRAPILVRTVHNVDDFYVSPRYARLSRLSATKLDRI